MRKFNEVLKFEQNGNKAKDLIDLTIKFAEHSMADKAGKNYTSKFTLSEEAKMINGIYSDLVKSRAGYKAETFDSIQDFAGAPNTIYCAQMINKAMLNAIYPVVFNTPFFNLVCQMHYLGYGETFQIDLKNNQLYNVSRFGRRQKHTFTQTREDASRTINTQRYGITNITNLPQILLGESMIVEDIMVAGLSMQAKVYQLAMAEFKTKTEAITIPQLVASGAFDEKTFLQKLKVVKAYSGNTSPVIFGDMIALKTLLPEAQSTRIDLQDPYNTTIGYMDRWNTYGVMAFDAIANDDGSYSVTGLEEDRLYSIAPSGNKFIHVGIGQLMSNTDNEFDNANLSVLSTMSQEIGVELITNEVMAVYKLA